MIKTNKLYIFGSLLILLSALFSAPKAVAQTTEGDNDTRVEKYQDLTETESNSDSTSEMNADMEETKEAMQETEEDAEGFSTRTEKKLEEYNDNK